MLRKKAPVLSAANVKKLYIVVLNVQVSRINNWLLSGLRKILSLECNKSSPRRTSFIIPSDEDEEDMSDSARIDVKKLAKAISKEVETAMKREMKDICDSIQYHTDRLEEVAETVDACKQLIKELQRKNVELNNKNKNLETRVAALEQRLNEQDQKRLSSCIEVVNVPQVDNENVTDIANNIACKLKMLSSDILNVKRNTGRKDRPGSITVEMKEENIRDMWISEAKNKRLKVKDIITNVSRTSEDIPVFIREGLTSHNKMLLWNAKNELKNTFKFVWCKRGVVLARKEEKDKEVIRIRSMEDIKDLLAR